MGYLLWKWGATYQIGLDYSKPTFSILKIELRAPIG